MQKDSIYKKVILIRVRHSNTYYIKYISTIVKIIICSYFLVLNLEYLMQPAEEVDLNSNQIDNNNMVAGSNPLPMSQSNNNKDLAAQSHIDEREPSVNDLLLVKTGEITGN